MSAKREETDSDRGEPGFDQKLAQLEKLVADLERGDLGLEASIETYKEGVGLLKGCRKQLAGYRSQVQELLADADGETRPFEADPDTSR